MGEDGIVGEHVVLRPVREEDAPRLRAIHETPEVVRWWGEPDDGFPWDEPGTTRLAIELDGRVVGMIQWGEEADPEFRHAWIDVFLDPGVHGRGLGADAVGTLARHLLDAHGHHRVTIDPAVENRAAVRAYEKAGFRPVGTLEAAWLDPTGAWVDVLLLELVRRPGAA